MKRFLFVFIAFCLCFTSCATFQNKKNSALEYLTDDIPDVYINNTDNYYGVMCLYDGPDWIFLTGVHLKNSNGDTINIKFDNVKRRVSKDGSVSESGSAVPYDQEYFAAFVAAGGVTARPLADDEFYDFAPARLNIKN